MLARNDDRQLVATWYMHLKVLSDLCWHLKCVRSRVAPLTISKSRPYAHGSYFWNIHGSRHVILHNIKAVTAADCPTMCGSVSCRTQKLSHWLRILSPESINIDIIQFNLPSAYLPFTLNQLIRYACAVRRLSTDTQSKTTSGSHTMLVSGVSVHFSFRSRRIISNLRHKASKFRTNVCFYVFSAFSFLSFSATTFALYFSILHPISLTDVAACAENWSVLHFALKIE